MKTAVFALSADPITNGHIDIIKRAAGIFEKLIVAIGENPDKKYLFSLEQRKLLTKSVLKHIRNVEVISFSGLLSDYVYENKIDLIVKGIRNEADLNYEIILSEVNKNQKNGVETIFLPSNAKLAHISSSIVKSIVKEQGSAHQIVPIEVKKEVELQMNGQRFIGISGEIAAGKSTISKKLATVFEQKGEKVTVVELDDIGHEILETLSEPVFVSARESIAKKFGAEILKSDGFIDRKKLGEIVFQDDTKLHELNRIMHDLILLRLRREIYGIKGVIILVAALFAETNMSYLFNNDLILVKCDERSQIRRLKERGFDENQIKRRVQTQFDYEKKKHVMMQQIERDNYGHVWEVENSDGVEVDGVLGKIVGEFLGKN